jgi:glutathione S-transferase
VYTLYIGNKNYSSWSLRAWALMRALEIAFEERRVLLYRSDSGERLHEISPSGKVPCLHDGGVVVWDTLAIAEYLAERHPGVWPRDAIARAWARSTAAEMHSGFAPLREEMGMNVRLRAKKTPSLVVAANIERIAALWTEGRERFGAAGDFLCGSFGAVDAFWCPVAFRFQSYGVAPSGVAGDYLAALLGHSAMRAWAAEAAQETERIPELDQVQTQAQQ